MDMAKQADRAVPHMIEQPPRSRHDNVGTLPQPSHLSLHIGSAHHRRGKQLQIATQRIDRRLNLYRQLACRR
jgi:hypothetical protein